ncbi:MAG: zinc ribbon domain-containing protein [Promethearchaeota archaeon]
MTRSLDTTPKSKNIRNKHQNIQEMGPKSDNSSRIIDSQIKCSYCGAGIEKETIFCPLCGTKT